MSKILFVPHMERGHLQPLVGVMQALCATGHELALAGIPVDALVRQLASAGIPLEWLAQPSRPPASMPSARKVALLRDPRRLLRWTQAAIANALTPAQVDSVRDAIGAFGPDVVCCDPLALHASVAAELERVPWAVLSTDLAGVADPSWRYPRADVFEALTPVIHTLMRELGASAPRVTRGEVVSPWLNMVFTTEAFVPRAWSGNDHAWYVGPSRPLGRRGDEEAFPWERLLEHVPIVYVSAGGGQSVSFEPDQLLAIARSVGEDEAQVVLALHDLVDHPFVRELPRSAVAVRYAPQLELLEKRAAVMVTHGGLNSVNECLHAGRPMLVSPIAHEQFVQAFALERLGGGLRLPFEALSEARCRPLLRRLLDPAAGFVEALEPVRRSYAQNGALEAARLVERLASTRAPLLPPS